MANRFRSIRLIVALIAFGVVSVLEAAADAGTDLSRRAEGCFRFNPVDSVAEIPDTAEEEQVWCYRSVDGQPGARYIFNADESEVRPELAAVVSSDGELTHASLLDGELSFHRLNVKQFNPLPVPLSPPLDSVPVDDKAFRHLDRSANDVLAELQTAPAEFEDLSFFAKETDRGVDSERGFKSARSAPLSGSAKLPWRGFWWSYKSLRLANDSNSPMAKYDKFVRARGGKSSAQAWEIRNHSFRGVKWEGHCNGWAGSAILRSEPRRSIRDPISGVTFNVSDIKGLLAEHDVCAKYAMFGRRYRQNSREDLRDIEPSLFHQVLTYYIGRLHKALAFDRIQGIGIENNIISGYKMSLQKSEGGSYLVTANLKMHRYDKSPSNTPGVAPSYLKTFKYKLRFDRAGNIVSGTWLTKNPDFIWIPLSPASCKRKNPDVTTEWLEQIIGRTGGS